MDNPIRPFCRQPEILDLPESIEPTPVIDGLFGRLFPHLAGPWIYATFRNLPFGGYRESISLNSYYSYEQAVDAIALHINFYDRVDFYPQHFHPSRNSESAIQVVEDLQECWEREKLPFLWSIESCPGEGWTARIMSHERSGEFEMNGLRLEGTADTMALAVCRVVLQGLR